MEEKIVVVIPAEGDSSETASWYAEAVVEHYGRQPKRNLTVYTYNPAEVLNWRSDDELDRSLERFCRPFWHQAVEIHAQAGLGALIACRIFELELVEQNASRCFFVGGASCEAMTGIAKFFHRYFAHWWYWSHIPFFADDPNPQRDPTIAAIKRSSTRTMRANPRRYRDQLVRIGHWFPNDFHLWRILPYRTWFVPNGKAPWPQWWNNTYNNARAIAFWARCTVRSTDQPGNGFSLYSMMPADALFQAMDSVREF